MKSVLIIGLGRFGYHMAKRFLEDGNTVLGLDTSEERADALVNEIPNIEIADGREEAVIRSLGVSNFDLCVVAIGDSFQTALEITVLLKDMGAKYIVARAGRDVHRKLLLRNGADHVVYSEKDIAERLAIRFGCDNILDYVGLTEDIGIYEITTPKAWVGKTILEVNVRAKYGLNIIGSKRDERVSMMLEGGYVFNEEDSLIVAADEKSIRKITKD